MMVGLFLFGILLSGIGVVLLEGETNAHNWYRTMEDFHWMLHSKKLWCGWICLLLGVFIMMAPILPIILR